MSKMQKVPDPIIEVHYKVTRDTKIISIVEHEDKRIPWD